MLLSAAIAVSKSSQRQQSAAVSKRHRRCVWQKGQCWVPVWCMWWLRTRLRAQQRHCNCVGRRGMGIGAGACGGCAREGGLLCCAVMACPAPDSALLLHSQTSLLLLSLLWWLGLQTAWPQHTESSCYLLTYAADCCVVGTPQTVASC